MKIKIIKCCECSNQYDLIDIAKTVKDADLYLDSYLSEEHECVYCDRAIHFRYINSKTLAKKYHLMFTKFIKEKFIQLIEEED